MNPGPSANKPPSAPSAGGLTLDDVIFVLFRRKWLILAFVCLGIAGAFMAWAKYPPLYVSRAKVFLRYLKDPAVIDPLNPESGRVQRTEAGNQTMASEMEIFTSLDVATQAVYLVGPEKILAKHGGSSNAMWASSVVASGLKVDAPHGPMLSVSYKHRDPDIAREVLGALIQSYEDQHEKVRNAVGEDQGFMIKRNQARAKLERIDEELAELKKQANLFYLDTNTMRFFQEQITKAEADYRTAKQDLSEHLAIFQGSVPDALLEHANTVTDAPALVPPDTLKTYGEIVDTYEAAVKNYNEARSKYADLNPFVTGAKERVDKLSAQRIELERSFPALTNFTALRTVGGTNSSGADLARQLAQIRGLKARLADSAAAIITISNQASLVAGLESKILDAQRRRAEEQNSYEYNQHRLNETLKDSKATDLASIARAENPTPAELDYKKPMKMVAIVLLGCIGMGVGLAFLWELAFDRSIKRTLDVERHLKVPVFLTVPDTAWVGESWVPGWMSRGKKRPILAGYGSNGNGNGNSNHNGNSELALAPWDPAHHMQDYASGLRERVATYFEVRNLGLKKPKLVGVTGCSHGVGVTTLAGGLAAELSKTGDGNVLLVDMHGEQGTAHAFYKGKPGCFLSDVLNPDAEAPTEMPASANDFLAKADYGAGDKMVKVLPGGFNHLMPLLKATDYDYIVFDMPPVSQTSPTPRMASHMDLALLVVESGKTGQQAAARASALMQEARANVATVLNKQRSHVPVGLSQEG
jgi:polysaccharide biosynthesis transport protein